MVQKLMHGEIILDGHKLFISDWFAPSDGGSLDSPERSPRIRERLPVHQRICVVDVDRYAHARSPKSYPSKTCSGAHDTGN